MTPPALIRGIGITAAATPGLCELLTLTPVPFWQWSPSWISTGITLLGFATYLVLVGMMAFVGNALVAGLLIGLVWHHWRWPLWQAVLIASPYAICFIRTLPVPW